MAEARATWTDERLDDLSRRVEAGFARLDEDLRAFRSELGSRIDGLGGRIDRLERRIHAHGGRIDALSERIDAQGARIDALHRAILQVGGGMIAAILVATATLAVLLA